MATGGEIEDEANKLLNMLEKCSIGTGEEERCTPQCWTDSEIEVWNKKRSILLRVKNALPPILQFLVHRQQKVIRKIAEKNGFVIYLDRSINRLEAVTVGDQEEQALDKMIEKFIQQIEAVCDMYSVKAFEIEHNVWPCVEKEFHEKAKNAFEESNLQVYKKWEGTYCLIGFADTFEKYESLLLYISSQYKAIRIGNKELFDALELEKILDSGFKQVKVAVHGDLLLLHGDKEVIKECAKHYEELSKTENMHFAIRVVSKNMYEFLNMKRSKIYSCLHEKGFRVYWTVKKKEKKCFLTCSSISKKPEKKIDFLTNYIVKEIELEERYIQGEQVRSKIEQMKNAKLFTSESGLKTLVYYGNIDLLEKAEAKGTQQRFWFYQTIANIGLLRFLDRFKVQNFINSKLPNHAARWSIIEDKRKIRVSCHCLAEVDHLVSSILDQVWCVCKPAEVCQNDRVKQFWKDHSNFVEIKQCEKYCTFYVTVDLKDELGRLLGVQAMSEIDEDQNDSDICNEIPTERVNVFIEPDIKIYLFKRCNAQLTKISEDFSVCISYKGTSLELKGKSKEKVLHAKHDLLELLSSIVYQKDIVRIKRESWKIEILKKEIDELEVKNSCTFMLFKKDQESEYLKCWDAQNFRIVAAEGSLEDTICDVLVCFLDHNLQPVGRSSEKIFMTGGWTEIEDTVKNSKEIQRKNWLPNSSKCKVYSSGETGFLKCRQLLFVSSENLLKDIEEVWNKVLEDAYENQWRSICFPVELSQITDGFLARFLSILTKGVSKRLKNSFEIQFCAWDANESLRGRVLDICSQRLSSGYIQIHCLADEKERMQDTNKSLHSSIGVKLEKGSFLEVAEAKKVDVIVNSTNPELNLRKGLVSRIILERGGREIDDELSRNYKCGIEFGSIAISSGHPLGFQKIYHCALYYRWVSTGNFSLKVLKSLITRCLLNMEKDGLHTIAFPVLGTGTLCYPYIPVAKTIMECVTDFGKQHPKTCIQTVYIVVNEADIHCAQVFEDVFEDGIEDVNKDPDITSQLNICDILSKPRVSFLECRMLDRGILLQVLPDDIDELVDAVIKLSSKDNASGEVDLKWCHKRKCYSALIPGSMEHLQNIVDHCLRMFDSKRITSARIHITDSMKDSKTYTKVIEAFMKKLKQMNNDRYSFGFSLRKLQFLLCKEQYEKMESSCTTDPNVFYSLLQSAIWKDSSNTWKKKTVKRQRVVLVSVCGPSSDHVERALSEFRESAAYEPGNWCVKRDYNWTFVSSITNIKLNDAMEQGVSIIEIKEEDGIYHYDIDCMLRNLDNERGDKRPEKIRWLPGHEESKQIPGMDLWYVLLGYKWVLLPEITCKMLTDAKTINNREACDDQYVYDLAYNERKLKGRERVKEEIMFIKANDIGNMDSDGTNTKVPFIDAEKRGLKSLAIPAISSEAGKRGHAENRKEETTQRINLVSDDHLMFLKKLKFKDFFMQKHPSFDGEFRYDKDDSVFYLETSCTEEMKIEIEKTMNEFISSLKHIILDSKVKALLGEKDSKCALDFEQKLKDRKVNCFLIKPRGCIYTKPEYLERIKEVVDELFLCMTVRPEEPRYFHFTTENFQKFRIDHENKDFLFERNVGIISFAAFKSAVADKLKEAMSLYESDECKFVYTPMQAEAIQKWGPQKREEYWLFLNNLHSEGRYIYSRKAFLLNRKPTEEYIMQKLRESEIKALFEVESDYCVNLIALDSTEADRAVKVLEDSIHEIHIVYTDNLIRDISSNDFKHHFDKWKGKYSFEGLKTAMQDPEGILLATDDIVDDLKDLLNGKFCKQKSRGLEKTYRTNPTRAIIKPEENIFRAVEAQVHIRKIEEKD